MESYVLPLEQISGTQAAVVGGKGVNLAELSRIEGIRVPPAFCITTAAYQQVLAAVPSFGERLDTLSRLEPQDREGIETNSAEIRRILERVPMPGDIAAAIVRELTRLGEQAPYAVRSSATAEDLPTASFAGQQDSYLNIIGPPAILQHVSRCWASLFTARAVIYRVRNGIDHGKVQMAVIVQRMVFPDVSGVLFTADPVSGNRTIVSVEASFGLGEALVAGLVSPDVYKVRDGSIIEKTIGTKRLTVMASAAGGTHEEPTESARRAQPAMTDAAVERLAQLARRIESHFGGPQDIEWCLVDDEFYFVQSRPITTLFPVPRVDDGEKHVYVSVGHQQMMTDAMKPLGISMWQLSAARPMLTAGGRLFVDVTRILASPASRANFLMLARSDPLIGDALETILAREDFIPSLPNDPAAASGMPPATAPPIETDPAIVDELIAQSEASIAVLKRAIEGKSGPALLDFILADFAELKRILFHPRSFPAIMAGMEATWWLNDKLQAWLGEKNAADMLAQSAPNNVTSEMGLALLDVADAIRPHSEVVAFLRRTDDEKFLNELPRFPGGREARDAIEGWLEKYGMRGVGEIDITRPRWAERPLTLVPILLGHIDHFAPGESKRRFERGREEARKKEQELLDRVRSLPNGDEKAAEVKAMIDRLRTFIGYREYPKYGKVSRDFIYKQAMMKEAERLVRADVLRDVEDIFYLTFEELHEVVRTQRVDHALIRQRKDDFRWFESLRPPRVLTSEGEAVAGSYRREDLPAGALVGLAVSAGTVEGRARVIHDIAEADLEPGDILVTAYTDPSWTPAFISIDGLVTEAGGLMTHGAVIAREYGIPAVVGVVDATRLIQDGQRIRVHGTEGYVELLPAAGPAARRRRGA